MHFNAKWFSDVKVRNKSKTEETRQSNAVMKIVQEQHCVNDECVSCEEHLLYRAFHDQA